MKAKYGVECAYARGGKRQEAKGKNDLPIRHADRISEDASHLQFLPFGFCLLRFVSVRSTLPSAPSLN
jgi:hypothetical protein